MFDKRKPTPTLSKMLLFCKRAETLDIDIYINFVRILGINFTPHVKKMNWAWVYGLVKGLNVELEGDYGHWANTFNVLVPSIGSNFIGTVLFPQILNHSPSNFQKSLYSSILDI